ncbi:alpha/beta fold hydrolase [Rhizobium sp. L1K21]|uniref:alpha/beta fold hydrolase n=1 Tax=Rhizobium sp. L1K21 TaxID=2954933 RepID=UPI002093A9F3|nr:alpha/beta hydrolase [Rhizobium sp. L1K21]MCO6185000.1 alpha/beta hydrolase [Rhizobium sp. L1K21]
MMEDILHSTPGNDVPDNHIAGFFETHDGLALRYAIFRSPVSIAKGTIVLLQGRNESIEKYFETIRELTEQGFWVATFDWRGQGGSPRLIADHSLGHVHRFADYEKDLEAFLEKIVLPDTRLPFFMVAHSMGALIALSTAPRLANRIDRIALSAPLLELSDRRPSSHTIMRVARFLRLFGLGRKALSKSRPHTEFAGNVLTSDPDRYARNRAIVKAHPEFALGPPTASWIDECLRAGQRVSTFSHLDKIMVPTIVLAPTQDAVVSYPAIERLSRYFRAGHFIPIDGAKHELFQERDRYRAQAMSAVLAFLPGS